MTIEEAYKPRWFEKGPDKAPEGTKGRRDKARYFYKGGYWEARETGHFFTGHVRDIFGTSRISPYLGPYP